ncbi:archaeosortase/exosortase family protein [Oleiphilus sp. HI0066]|uniref:archaeosortase/exosortase family protein n=5 Tax=unclassified Oleiphilus TaxID=2631174 RepID=UPI0007C3A0E8|nr:archaeosortase/exosortase family protein [Oleiphilus sp. HI0066]KZY64391.1 hypothetical protein A3738_10415 [Oleiphilus sp. HI0066]
MAGWILPTLTHTYLQLSSLFLAVFFVFYPTTEVLLDRWLKFDESLSHGLLVIAMSIHLSARTLHRIETQNIKNGSLSNYLTYIGLALSSLAWLVISSANINILEQVLIPIILWFATASYLGLHIGLKLLPSIAFVYFAIPIWDYLNQALVDLSSLTVTWLVDLIDITALIEANTITLPYGALVIADGCSGLRYFTIACALAVYVILDSKPNRALSTKLLATAIALSLFSNWLRIFLLILIAYETNMESSLVADHETFGWIIFCIVLAPLFFIARRFELFPEQKEPSKQALSIKKIALTFALLMLTPVLSFALNSAIKVPNIISSSQLSYTPAKPDTNIPKLPNAKILLQKKANNYVQNIQLYRVLNWKEESTENLVPYWPSPFSHTDWLVESRNIITADTQQFQYVGLKHKLRGYRVCLAYRYQVGQQEALSYKKAKLLQIPAILTGTNYFEAQLAITNAKDCAATEPSMINALTELNTPLIEVKGS